MALTYLVVLDGHVRLARALALGDLHEKSADQRLADVLVVLLVLERRAHQLDLVCFHDSL